MVITSHHASLPGRAVKRCGLFSPAGPSSVSRGDGAHAALYGAFPARPDTFPTLLGAHSEKKTQKKPACSLTRDVNALRSQTCAYCHVYSFMFWLMFFVVVVALDECGILLKYSQMASKVSIK